ncbi:MAG: ACT domain-containing protein [Actinomycetaceae bacterium]|nr:ACT domain-containing protein [Actinomycetaceae bacterium]
MSQTSDLDRALASLDPTPSGTYVFALVEEIPAGYTPFAIVRDESEWTIIIDVEQAQSLGLSTEKTWAQIHLGLTTELESVGLTASIAQILSARSISANFVTSYRHAHLFVQSDRAEEAAALLADLGRHAKGWLPVL